MRILIKGGIWKNTEDEILKAAVMKYGKNQWARAASLMNRKSAKQCKARWYEWLDPSIKKIEWSREEEEKLLHLAKLMPNQWRTIAPIVGRTANQCMEQYERLLDQAQEGSTDGTDSSDDPRRLRPGEIDPTPETKPARPDPIDMDEDEKEMLSEARARLANTQGKKAKRKARERLLDESRKLAMLQKRRELKAAGIESRLGMRKRSEIDYAREIPFQKVPPAGFHDVAEENQESKRARLDIHARVLEAAQLEGYRHKEEEEKLRAFDRRKMKAIMAENAPAIIQRISEENDPTSLRRRGVLELPAPQVTDEELEEIVKVSASSLMPPPVGGMRGGRGQSTQMLLGDYSAVAKATPTPMRTPVQEDRLMQEARNLVALRGMAPLVSSENDEELPELQPGFGFDGATPNNALQATPNLFVAQAGVAAGATPLSRAPGMTPMLMNASHKALSAAGGHASALRTPLRDQFGLNDHPNSDSFSVSDMASVSSRQNKASASMSKSLLSQQLKSLPEPEYTYEISIPKIEDVEEEEDAMVEDAADVEERQRLAQEAQALLEYNRRSSVLKRDLPRPYITNPIPIPENKTAAERMILEEMSTIMLCDQYRFPDAEQQPSAHETIVMEIEFIPDNYLADARELLSKEAENAESMDMMVEQYVSVWEDFHKQALYIPTRGDHGEYGIPANKSETLTALATQFNSMKTRIEKDMKKISKLESKLQITTQGYAKRSQALIESIQNQYAELSKLSTELGKLSCLRITLSDL
jgi:pre-mRNA-splicing factor CDC5/CEF1